MRHECNRRDFIRTTAAGALALGGAARLTPHLGAQEVATPASTLGVAVGDSPAELTRRAIGAVGGIRAFVPEGSEVIVKPNIGWARTPELAANTNPDVVGALVRLCVEAGAKTVKVGDHPCQPARQAYRNSGIAKAVEAAGGKMVYLDRKRFVDMELGGEFLETWPLYKEIVDADLVISVPVVKHHGLTRCSIAMKNYMGVIGGNRSAWHQNIDVCLSDITRFMKPRLSVLDAVRVLTDHGPQGGDPADVEVRGVVAASTDIVALDAFGASLLGYGPEEASSVAAAAERGLGTADFASLEPVERILS